jgi:RNA polymerase sigma-70 factor (ECF subfamily)
VEKFPGWLIQIAVRLSINRAVRRPHEVAQDTEIMVQFDGAETQPETQALLSERADQLRSGLAKLKPLDRETLMAFYFQGQSLQEMSRRFDSPVGTIKRRLHTARHRLKAHLEEFQTA